MKQRINIDQLQELTSDQQNKLRDLWKPKQYDYVAYTYEYYEKLITNEVVIKGLYNNDPNFVEEVSDLEGEYVFPKCNCLPLMNIGQMIEILGNDWYDELFICQFYHNEYYVENSYDGEFVDALWEKVKYIL